MDRRDYEDRPDPRQMAIFAAMSAERKLEIMTSLRDGARELKRSYLRQTQPNLSEAEIEALVRKWFFNVTP